MTQEELKAKALRNIIKPFIPVVIDALGFIFTKTVQYKKEKLMPGLKENESDVRLVLFEKDDSIYATLTAFDQNGTITRQIPFDAEGTKIAVPAKELIGKLLKSI